MYFIFFTLGILCKYVGNYTINLIDRYITGNWIFEAVTVVIIVYSAAIAIRAKSSKLQVLFDNLLYAVILITEYVFAIAFFR